MGIGGRHRALSRKRRAQGDRAPHPRPQRRRSGGQALRPGEVTLVIPGRRAAASPESMITAAMLTPLLTAAHVVVTDSGLAGLKPAPRNDVRHRPCNHPGAPPLSSVAFQ